MEVKKKRLKIEKNVDSEWQAWIPMLPMDYNNEFSLSWLMITQKYVQRSLLFWDQFVTEPLGSRTSLDNNSRID